MKIALFGGSFDPFHKSHLEVINWCKNKLGFDKIWVILAFQNPFKNHVFSTPKQRKEIIQVATNGLGYINIIDYEINKGKATPTYETVKYLKKKYPQHDFTFIIGLDILKDFEKWHNFKKLIKLVKFRVFERQGYEQYIEVARKYNLEIIDFDNSQLNSTDIRNQKELENQLSVVNNYVANNFLYYQNKLKNSLLEDSYKTLELSLKIFKDLFSKDNPDYLIYKNALLISYTCYNSKQNDFKYLKKSIEKAKKEIMVKTIYNTKILNIVEDLANLNLKTYELKILFLIICYSNILIKKV